MLRKIRNYLCYCGIEKEEYRVIKKDAYVSNFEVWRVLHCLMAAVFAALYIASLSVDIMAPNRLFYLIIFLYSAITACMFLFLFKKDAIAAQLVIYLSISLLLLFGCFITQNKPDSPGTTFIVIMLLSPMLMIDKPYFMAIELCVAAVIYMLWMHAVKPYDIWRMDAGNVIVFTVVGIFLHIIANSIRIREFVLTRKIRIQKDTDDMTGLMSKSAITGAINSFLKDPMTDKGILLVSDIDRFKSVNDTYGHDVGDDVIRQFGAFLHEAFTGDEIVGRFGGDEFIVFIRNSSDRTLAEETACRIVDGVAGHIVLPDRAQPVSVSVGIAVYRGAEKNYSELFKKADVALYDAKADAERRYAFYRAK